MWPDNTKASQATGAVPEASTGQTWIAIHDIGVFAGAHCHEVRIAEWPDFCRWFSTGFRGVTVTVQTSGENGTKNEAINLPLEFIEPQVLENRIGVLTVAVKAGSRLHRLDITSAMHMRMYCNAAGWPRELKILTANGEVSLVLSGGIECPAQFNNICWGE